MSELKDNVKQWLLLNREIIDLKKRVKVLTGEKKEITKYLTNVMDKTGTDSFDTKSGKVVYVKNKVKKTINKKYLNECLKKFIADESQAEELSNYIYENREIKIRQDIKLKENNGK